MPIYEYICTACGFKEDVLEKIDGPTIKPCPHCGVDEFVRPEISAPAFHLKGGGWYKDGYSNASTKRESAKPGPAPKKTESPSGNSGTSE